MYNFILQIIVMLSLGVLIYLAARAVPRVSETEIKAASLGDHLDRWIKKLPLEKMDAWLSSQVEKFLRKFKVAVLKLDNLLTKHLSNLKSPVNGGKPTLFEKKEDSEVK